MKASLTKRVLVVEDHGMFLDAIRFYLNKSPELSAVGCTTKKEALLLIESAGPYDIILVDMMLPDTASADDHIDLIEANQSNPVVLVSGFAATKDIERAKEIGMRGFVSKLTPASQFLEIVKHILSGGTSFPKEQDVVQKPSQMRTNEASLEAFEQSVMHHLRSGMSNVKIARELKVRVSVVERTVSAIYKKLGVRTRLQAALKDSST